ncbi:MAG: hypothetical protein NY202_05615 [Mollicutes bacterium UO1]
MKFVNNPQIAYDNILDHPGGSNLPKFVNKNWKGDQITPNWHKKMSDGEEIKVKAMR